MKHSRLLPFAAILLCTPLAAAQYELTATATATSSPDITDETTTEANVFAANTGGNPNAKNPTSVSTSAAGSPNAAFCNAFAAAETVGIGSVGTGFGRLRAINDIVSFNAAAPFTVLVTFDLDHEIVVNWDGDFGRVEAFGSVRRRFPSGASVGTPGFEFSETASNGQTIVNNDERDPIQVEMQPGDTLQLGISVTTTATARATFGISDGNVSVNAVCRLYVEVIEGDAQIAGSVSGAAYGPPPCNAADLANPRGVLDLADIGAFVTAFQNGDAALADLNGDTLIDLADIGIFVTAFTAGCP